MSQYGKPVYKGTADTWMRRGFDRMGHMSERNNLGGNFSRGGFMQAGIDWSQLPLRSSRFLCNTSGQFYFIPGLSIVGGGDIVRP